MDLDEDIRKLGVSLEIDEMLLEEEWVRHPQMVYNVGAYVAKLQFEADQAKYDFDIICADLDRKIRENPDDYSVRKVTENSVFAATRLEPEYRAAHSRLLEARLKLQHAEAAANALEHKKRALSMLVELYTHEYYSESGKGQPMSEEDREAAKIALRKRGRERRKAIEESSGERLAD